ncbi:MAG: hypothetical protein FJW27_05455 [Acidimicrobiia bacterium]|nr:hypothetical protein [Acidimicrobiia bacterium]
MRIQFYLQGRVDETEGALGITLPGEIDSRLFNAVRRRIYGSVERMRRLREIPPDTIVATVEPIVERWFVRDAVPAVRRYLESRPFQAYWYFARTGGVGSPGPVFPGSQTAIERPAFSLTGLTMTEAFAQLRSARVPPAFLNRHAELESAFTDATLTRDEAIARTARLSSTTRAALRDFLLADEGTEQVSSLDVYARVIRDASLIRGRLDRRLVGSAMALVHAAKAERLGREVQRILADEPSPHPQLEAYLRGSAALMLELERR